MTFVDVLFEIIVVVAFIFVLFKTIELIVKYRGRNK